MNAETLKARRVQKALIERLKKVALGQPVGRPATNDLRKPWQRLGNHHGRHYFEVECSGCGRMLYFQIKYEKGILSWRPYNPYGNSRRRVPVQTAPLAEELVTQMLRRTKKSLVEQILDEHTHDPRVEDNDAD